MSVETIKEYAKSLRCGYIRNNLEDFILEATVEQWNPEELIEAMFKRECDSRHFSTIERYIKTAKFPYKMSFDMFSTSHLSAEVSREVRRFSTLEFIKQGNNAILIGNPGVGKTALSIAIGEAACRAGMRVLFVNVSNLVIQVKEAMSSNDMMKFKKNFERFDLVILDDLGYCSFSKECGEMLFNLLSDRNEDKSIVVTTNLTFDRWHEVFGDKVLTGCIVDRIQHKAHIVDMTGSSYRVMETRKWMKEGMEEKAG